jgi:predicted O-methyltransferase YrrM
MAIKPFSLSLRHMSGALWARIFENSASLLRAQGDDLFRQLGTLESLRAKAQYNTGSIPLATQWALFALAYYTAPQVVAEVGTFIGKSAVALARGMDAAGSPGELHTCDASNRIDLPALTQTEIEQYPGSSSTQMLSEMLEDGYAGRVDLLHLDGRLMKDDMPLVQKLCAPHAVIVLDDFESIEKGVINLMSLRAADPFSRWLLAYPPAADLLLRYGLPDHSTTALLFPNDSLQFTAQ